MTRDIRPIARPAGCRCLRPGRVQMEHSVTLVPANARRYFPAAAVQAALHVRQIRRVLRSFIHDESEGSAALLLSGGLVFAAQASVNRAASKGRRGPVHTRTT